MYVSFIDISTRRNINQTPCNRGRIRIRVNAGPDPQHSVFYSDNRFQITQWAAFYEHRLNKGSKAIYHLEAFVAKFMSVHMKYMEEALGAF